MIDKISEVFGEIFDDEKLIREFSEIDDVEEMYRFCLSIKGGYTREEFHIFLESLIRVCEGKSPLVYNSDTVSKLGDKEVDSVSGGVSLAKKWLAGGLAAAALFSSGASTFAANNQNVKAFKSSSRKKATNNAEEAEENTSTWGGWIKSKLKSIGKGIWNHKGKIAIGAITLLSLYLLGKYISNKNPEDNTKELVTQFTENKKLVMQKTLKKMAEAQKEGTTLTAQQLVVDLNGSDGKGFQGYGNGTIKITLESLEDLGVAVKNDKGEINLKDGTAIGKDWNALSTPSQGGKSVLLDPIIKVLGGTSVAVAGSAIANEVTNLFSKGTGGIESGSKFLTTTEKGLSSLGRLISNISYSVQNALKNLEKPPYDKEEKTEELNEQLEEVRGQEKVKQKVRGFFQQVVNDRERCKMTGEKGKCKVIAFNGPSGTGKSFTATKLASALSNAEPYVMSASEVDPQAGSIVEQLFTKREYDPYSWTGTSDRGFARYLQDHSNDGVVIINEYDKMYDGKGDRHPLDETLRSFIDEGKHTIAGREYDCSGITFILTTNESRGSLKGLVTSPKPGILIDPTEDEDNTRSRTKVVHDKSFLNRLTIAEFENLSREEYEQIAADKFAPTLDFLEQEEGGGITVNISDESYEKMGEFLELINEGARPIDGFIGSLFVEVVNKTSELREAGKDFKNVTMNATFHHGEKDEDFGFDMEVIENEEQDEEQSDENSEEQGENQGTEQSDEQSAEKGEEQGENQGTEQSDEQNAEKGEEQNSNQSELSENQSDAINSETENEGK